MQAEFYPIRLNKFIAQQAGISRRQADDYISHKRVRINGRYAILGATINPQTDTILLDEKPLQSGSRAFQYILLNKPTGYICSRRQQGDIPTIYSLLPAQYHHLKPVGRLDKASSGILLLTNDGDLALHMTHPRFHKVKVYDITLDKPLEPLHHQQISDFGLLLPDGRSQLQLQKLSDDRRQWQVTMHEGRNRQIRRTFAALGYTVTTLHRIQFGSLSINDLQSQLYKIVQKPII